MRLQFSNFAFGLALSTVAEAARAGVIVTGTLDHLHIEASRAPILEVMEALKKQFGIAYRYSARPQWTVDGAFTGSLASVLPRVFRDQDYVFRIEPNHSMTVFFSSPQGPPSAAVSIPSPAAAQNPSPAAPNLSLAAPIQTPQGPPSAAPSPPPVQALGPNPSDEQARRRSLHPSDSRDDEDSDISDKPPL